jgi:hypothetical protein
MPDTAGAGFCENRLLDGIASGVSGVVPFLIMQDLTDGTGRFSSMQGVVAASLGFGAHLRTPLFYFVFRFFVLC